MQRLCSKMGSHLRLNITSLVVTTWSENHREKMMDGMIGDLLCSSTKAWSWRERHKETPYWLQWEGWKISMHSLAEAQVVQRLTSENMFVRQGDSIFSHNSLFKPTWTVLCAMKSGLQGTRFAGASCVSPSHIFSAVCRKQSRSQLKIDQLFVCDRVFSHPLKPCEASSGSKDDDAMFESCGWKPIPTIPPPKKTSQNSDVIYRLVAQFQMSCLLGWKPQQVWTSLEVLASDPWNQLC